MQTGVNNALHNNVCKVFQIPAFLHFFSFRSELIVVHGPLLKKKTTYNTLTNSFKSMFLRPFLMKVGSSWVFFLSRNQLIKT